MSIATLTGFTLCLKGFNAYKYHKYMTDEDKKKHFKPLAYVLHGLHIPPYLIAAYWYYDSYKHLKT